MAVAAPAPASPEDAARLFAAFVDGAGNLGAVSLSRFIIHVINSGHEELLRVGEYIARLGIVERGGKGRDALVGYCHQLTVRLTRLLKLLQWLRRAGPDVERGLFRMQAAAVAHSRYRWSVEALFGGHQALVAQPITEGASTLFTKPGRKRGRDVRDAGGCVARVLTMKACELRAQLPAEEFSIEHTGREVMHITHTLFKVCVTVIPSPDAPGGIGWRMVWWHPRVFTAEDPKSDALGFTLDPLTMQRVARVVGVKLRVGEMLAALKVLYGIIKGLIVEVVQNQVAYITQQYPWVHAAYEAEYPTDDSAAAAAALLAATQQRQSAAGETAVPTTAQQRLVADAQRGIMTGPHRSREDAGAALPSDRETSIIVTLSYWGGFDDALNNQVVITTGGPHLPTVVRHPRRGVEGTEMTRLNVKEFLWDAVNESKKLLLKQVAGWLRVDGYSAGVVPSEADAQGVRVAVAHGCVDSEVFLTATHAGEVLVGAYGSYHADSVLRERPVDGNLDTLRHDLVAAAASTARTRILTYWAKAHGAMMGAHPRQRCAVVDASVARFTIGTSEGTVVLYIDTASLHVGVYTLRPTTAAPVAPTAPRALVAAAVVLLAGVSATEADRRGADGGGVFGVAAGMGAASGIIPRGAGDEYILPSQPLRRVQDAGGGAAAILSHVTLHAWVVVWKTVALPGLRAAYAEPIVDLVISPHAAGKLVPARACTLPDIGNDDVMVAALPACGCYFAVARDPRRGAVVWVFARQQQQQQQQQQGHPIAGSLTPALLQQLLKGGVDGWIRAHVGPLAALLSDGFAFHPPPSAAAGPTSPTAPLSDTTRIGHLLKARAEAVRGFCAIHKVVNPQRAYLFEKRICLALSSSNEDEKANYAGVALTIHVKDYMKDPRSSVLTAAVARVATPLAADPDRQAALHTLLGNLLWYLQHAKQADPAAEVCNAAQWAVGLEMNAQALLLVHPTPGKEVVSLQKPA